MRDIDKSPFEPEISLTESNRSEQNDKIVDTGTTTVGIAVNDGVAVATDRRASLGGQFVSSKSVVKVEEIHPTGVITMVGSVGGSQSYNQQLKAEVSLYRSRREKNMSISALAKLASNFARGGEYYRINPIVGGVDDEGSHIFSIDPAGGLIEDDYTVNGSGMQIAYGTLEAKYSENLDLDEALKIAAEAVQSASERDSGSGNGLALSKVDSEGVEINTHQNYDIIQEL